MVRMELIESSLQSEGVNMVFFFFFKQKTAYEIGLGIPAEPLFRSTLFPYTPTAISIFVCLSMVQLMAVFRSEERRVGKECRSRWVSAWLKKKASISPRRLMSS